MTQDTITDRFSGQDRAVSPVIGVILMVAITVILAAVIGTFVLDLGQSTGQVAPQSSLQYSSNGDGTVSVDHQGDRLEANNTDIVVRNGSSGDSHRIVYNDSQVWEADGGGLEVDGFDDRIATGERFTIIGLTEGIEYEIVVIDTETNQQISESSIVA